MLKINNLLLVLLTAFALSSCEKELILPAGEAPETQAIFGLNGPANPCGTFETANVITQNGTIVGYAEILNDNKDLYVQMQLNHGWVITKAYAYAGKLNQLPMTAQGNPNFEAFPFKPYFGRGANAISIRIPLAGLPACYEISTLLQIAELDLFGNIIADDTCMLDGTFVGNGTVKNYCTHVCSTVNIALNSN
jgi:hypothetical protein